MKWILKSLTTNDMNTTLKTKKNHSVLVHPVETDAKKSELVFCIILTIENCFRAF